jgi:NAD(P)H-dependent flavin oxidoreductase YrpB (nitropropane dioxygenase family)
VGTRFLASEEAGVAETWKQRIVEIESEEAVRFETTGQTAGLIDDVLPAAEIVRRMVSEDERALERARGGKPVK